MIRWRLFSPMLVMFLFAAILLGIQSTAHLKSKVSNGRFQQANIGFLDIEPREDIATLMFSTSRRSHPSKLHGTLGETRIEGGK